jgi:peroxiredoxin
VPRPDPTLVSRRRLLAFGASALLGTPAVAGSGPYARRALFDQGGAEQSLAEVAAKKTLIVVVMKGHYCPVCRAQLARLQELRQPLEQLGTVCCGLNADPVAANRVISEKFGFEMPILSDPMHSVLAALGLWLEGAAHPMPAIIVYDQCGNEARRILGRDGNDRPEATLLRLVKRLHDEPPQCQVA